jgi:hypothetical protein
MKKQIKRMQLKQTKMSFFFKNGDQEGKTGPVSGAGASRRGRT